MVNRIITFALFFIIFLLIYFGVHFYIFARISSLLEIERTFWFYLIGLIVVLSFPIFSVLERTIGGSFLRGLYALSAIWLGAAFFIFCCLIIYEITNMFVKVNSKAAGVIVLVVALSITLFSLINALSLDTKIINIPMPNLKNELKIVQLSDMHIGTIHNSGYLEKIVEKVNNLNPDMVLITGDIVDGSGILTEESISPLNKLEPKTFFTLGNHEQYEGVEYVLNLLKNTKIQILRNEIFNYKDIQIIGVDAIEEFQNKSFDLSSFKINKLKPSVLMYHLPTNLEKANEVGINLQLSGHTHNGQIFPFSLLSRIFFPRVTGLYDYNGTYMYVSPGTGTWGPPLRFGSRNEITVINLIKNEN